MRMPPTAGDNDVNFIWDSHDDFPIYFTSY